MNCLKLRQLGLTLTLSLLCSTSTMGSDGSNRSDGKAKPNFVFFLVDDLGWADIGANGSRFHSTPNIDELSDSGMRFTFGYAACPVCSPTRASILTGRHPVRVDITDWIPGQNSDASRGDRFRRVEDRDNLALEEVTIAEVLHDNGYQTFFAGKWHLGDQGHWPLDQGFDINIGGNSKGSPPGGYYAPWNNPTLEAKEEGEYLTERLTSESIRFLRERDTSRPFFLYLSYYNVHTPITPYKKRHAEFQRKKGELFGDSQTPTRSEHEGTTRLRQDDPRYASMVAAVDDSVGSILDALDELQLDEQTVVCFFSDNGGLSTLQRIAPTSNEPLRAGKGWLYEGGIREPMIIRAPGVTTGGEVCHSPVVSMDFFPTILDLADIELQPDLHRDGKSLRPLLEGKELPERNFYWHYPHYHGSTWKPGAAIRSGKWKLIEFYHWETVELYDLDSDPSEQHDLSSELPEKTKELLDQLHKWQVDMNAKMPVPF